MFFSTGEYANICNFVKVLRIEEVVHEGSIKEKQAIIHHFTPERIIEKLWIKRPLKLLNKSLTRMTK